MAVAECALPVIVVSYNTCELLRRCLSALLQSDGVSVQPIVVDNASNDGSAQMVRDVFAGVRVIALESNQGFAAANNVALRSLGAFPASANQATNGTVDAPPPGAVGAVAAPSAEYILLLNPDTEVRPDAVAILLSFMRANPRAGAAGAQLLYADGQLQQSAFRFPGLIQTFLDFFPLDGRILNSRANGRYPRRDRPFEIDHPLGACMLVRSATLAADGMMDEGYFMYVEEVDWCRRIKLAGWQVWCEPRARIVHHEGQSTRQFRDTMFVEKWRSRLRYFRKFHSPLYVSLVSAIVRIGLWNEMRKLSAQSLPSGERVRRLDTYTQVRALL